MTNYRDPVTCARCAEYGHDSKPCEKAERRANCNGNHAVYCRFCPNWIREKEILAIKITKKLSSPKAPKLTESRTNYLLVSLSPVYVGNNQNLYRT